MAKEKRDKQGDKQQQEAKPAQAHHSAKEAPRLKSRFKSEVAPALMKEFDLKNPMAVPHINKIVVNMGMGEATQNAKILDPAVNELGQITGPETDHDQGQEIDCRLQGARRPGRSAPWSPCGATACMSFWTGC